jgi:hypothetical protein
LGINPDQLEFEPVPAVTTFPRPSAAAPSIPMKLTIAQAKRALAATFGVTPDAIEITIRG